MLSANAMAKRGVEQPYIGAADGPIERGERLEMQSIVVPGVFYASDIVWGIDRTRPIKLPLPHFIKR